MDTHHFGSILLGIGAVRADHFFDANSRGRILLAPHACGRRPPSFASVGFASVAVMVCLAVVALGLTA